MKNRIWAMVLWWLFAPGLGHALASEVVYRFDMDTDPGWSVEGQWAWGRPTGMGGDPSAGYTGTQVYGYNLSGTYSDNMSPQSLVAGPLNFDSYSQVQLAFRRWLGVESSLFDQASLAVSTNAVQWTTVWTNSITTLRDTSWQLVSYDLASVADRKASVYVRWTMGASDGSLTYSGWNIDDVEFSGQRVDALAVTPLEGISAMGLPGGPFTPEAPALTLSNSGPASVSWSASTAAGWLSLSPGSGTLAAGASAQVVVGWNGATAALAPGTYETSLIVSNVSTGLRFERALGLEIGIRSQTLTWTDPVPGTRLRVGQAETLSATASSGLAVSFSVSSGPASISGNELQPTGEGTVVVRAVQEGSAQYLPVEEERSFRIVRQSQTVTWTSPSLDGVLLVGQAYPLTASASSGLAVSYSLVSGPAIVSGGSVTATNWGSIVVAAEQSGNTTYDSDRVTRTLNRGSFSLAASGEWPGLPRGQPLSVVSSNGLAYVAQGFGGVLILDVTQPSSPVILGGFDTGGYARGIQVVGSVAYVADSGGGLLMLDVGEPTSPVLLGTYWANGNVLGIAVSGSLAFLANDTAGLEIVDVSDPAQPSLVGGYDTTGKAQAVTVVGSLAYVADHSSGLQVVGVGVPSAPVYLGGYDTSGNARSVRVAGTTAYVADEAGGLEILEVSNPALPVRLGGLGTGGLAVDLEIAGDRVFVANYLAGLAIVDVSDPTIPSLGGAYAVEGAVSGLALEGSIAFLAAGSGGLQVVDVSVSSAPTPQGGLNHTGFGYGFRKDGNRGYLADSTVGLQVLDLTDPGNPVLLGTYTTAGAALAVEVVDDLAFVALGNAGIEIVDVSQPAFMVQVGAVDTDGAAQSIRVVGDLAYVADELGGVQIFDVSMPSAPWWVGEFDGGGLARGLAVVGGLAFVADPLDGLVVLDVTDPSVPVQIGGYTTGGYLSDVWVSGGLAYLANGYGGLLVLDVSHPETPVRLGSVGTAGFAVGVWVENNLAVVASDFGGIEVFDVNDPTRPWLLGSLEVADEALTVQVEGDRIYTANGVWGLGVVTMVETRMGQTLSFAPPATATLADSPITLSATGSSGLPVTFAVVSGPGTVSGSELTLTGLGEVVIRAEQAGSALFEAISVDRTVVVATAVQTLVWTSPASGVPLLVNQGYPLTAGASSGLPVTFSIVSGPGEVADDELRATASGVVTVKADQAGNLGWEPVSELRTFTAVAITDLVSLDPEARVTPDPAKPGFLWRVFANPGNVINSLRRAEDALAGQLEDGSGSPLPNLADPNAPGAALAPASAASPANGSITFEIATFLNLGENDGDSTGWFVPDEAMPGVPATDGSRDGIAAEIVTYIDLPAGLITMGVTSDEGFRTQGGMTWDALGARTLGEWDGRRPSGETLFSFWVSEAGVYPFRTVYEEGDGDANIEWYVLLTDGGRVLLNDVENGGFTTYRAILGPSRPPFVHSVSPSPVTRLLDETPARVEIVLSDGEALLLDDDSIDLRIDGSLVTNRVRSGSQVTLTWIPTGLRVPAEVHQAELAFRSATGGYSRTESWSFRNLKNVVLPPTALVEETFDSVSEAGVPTGWVASNFTVSCNAGSNLLDPASDTYRDWVVVQTNTLLAVDPAAALEVADGEQLNGQPLTLEEWRSGRVLLAAATGRCNGTNPARPASGGANFGQAQFVVSRAFNLSTATNPVLVFSSAYTPADDSVGAVEYSTDGGLSWNPVVVIIPGFRAALRPDGTVDGVVTLGLPRSETALWSVEGVQKGNSFGDTLASTIGSGIDAFLQSRPTSGGNDGNRLEAFRLPLAAGRSDVRLRFASSGMAPASGRRWMIDNLRFYDIGAPTAVSLGSAFAAENAPIGTSVGRLQATDPDPTEAFTYALVAGDGGDDNLSFNLVGSLLSTAAVFDHETKSEYSVRVRATNGKGLWIEQVLVVTVPAPGTVLGRYVFYNQSSWDGNNAGATTSDDNAIATDKTPLFQGTKATFSHYTSFSRGLNGLMVDIAGLPVGTPTSADFGFKSGRTSTPSTWTSAPAPASISVRRFAGLGGSDRVTLIWGTNAVKKLWLQVRVRATAATGLAADDIFYFGNAIGEVGNSTSDALVNATDELRIRADPRNLLNPAAVTSRHDINRDKSVNSTDQLLARANITSPLNALPLITPGAPGSGASIASRAREPNPTEPADEASDPPVPPESTGTSDSDLVLPDDANARPRPVAFSIVRRAEGRLEIQVPDSSTGTFRLEFTDDLAAAEWGPVQTSEGWPTEVPSGLRVWVVTPDPKLPSRYFRVTRVSENPATALPRTR